MLDFWSHLATAAASERRRGRKLSDVLPDYHAFVADPAAYFTEHDRVTLGPARSLASRVFMGGMFGLPVVVLAFVAGRCLEIPALDPPFSLLAIFTGITLLGTYLMRGAVCHLSRRG